MHPLSRGAFQFSFTPGSCRYSPRYEHQGISAGTSSACTRACALFQVCCSYVESLRIRIDIYRAHLFEKRTANGKCKPFDFEYIVVISRLIQSQHQLIAASTRPAVYPDRRDILIFEIILQFLNSILTYLDHIHLLFVLACNAADGIGHEYMRYQLNSIPTYRAIVFSNPVLKIKFLNKAAFDRLEKICAGKYGINRFHHYYIDKPDNEMARSINLLWVLVYIKKHVKREA